MFNRYSIDNSQSIKINAVSGTIVKNYKESFILRFHMKSPLADKLLDASPELKVPDSNYKYKPAVVLQVMLCGEQELLAEVMWKSDFDDLFELKENKNESSN